jgi:streptogramin lyase
VDLLPAIPAATVRRAQQRRVMNSVVALATTAALVVGAVVGVNALRRGADEIPYVDQQIKPRQRVVIPVGGVPAEITIGFGSAWVERQDEVVRIDLRTNKVTAHISTAGSPRRSGGSTTVDHAYLGTPGLAAGEGAVWATGTGGFSAFSVQARPLGGPSIVQTVGGGSSVGFSATGQPLSAQQRTSTPPSPTPVPPAPTREEWSLFRIDPRTNTFEEIAALSGGTPSAIATGEKSVWVATGSGPNSRGAVYQFDPATGHRRSLTEFGGPVTGLAVENHFVWASVDVNTIHGRAVFQIDARTNKTVRRIPLPDAIATQDLAAANGSVWVTTLLSEGQSAIAQIDAKTGTLLRLVPFERPIVRLVSVGTNAVWLSTQDDPRLYRLDPALNEISGVLQVGGVPDDLVASGNSVWVLADPDGGDGPTSSIVIRFDV